MKYFTMFPDQAQLVGSLLLVEGRESTVILDHEVDSLEEACQIMLKLHKEDPRCSPVVHMMLKPCRR